MIEVQQVLKLILPKNYGLYKMPFSLITAPTTTSSVYGCVQQSVYWWSRTSPDSVSIVTRDSFLVLLSTYHGLDGYRRGQCEHLFLNIHMSCMRVIQIYISHENLICGVYVVHTPIYTDRRKKERERDREIERERQTDRQVRSVFA